MWNDNCNNLYCLYYWWENILNAVQDTYGAAGFNPFINKNLGWQYVAYTFLTVSATVLNGRQ